MDLLPWPSGLAEQLLFGAAPAQNANRLSPGNHDHGISIARAKFAS